MFTLLIVKPSTKLMMTQGHSWRVSMVWPTRRPYTMSAANRPKMLPEAPTVAEPLTRFESTKPAAPLRLKITNARAGP